MKLNQRQVDIVEALYNKHLDLANGDEGQRRQLTQKIDEQISFEFGMRWGMKARAGGNISNASKDNIAYLEDDATVSTWDWQNGSTRKPQVFAGMEPSYSHLPLSEAKFIQVNPINHLGVTNEPDDDEPDDDLDDDQVQDLVQSLNEMNDNLKKIIDGQRQIRESQQLMHDTLQLILDKPAPTPYLVIFPEYEGTISWSGKINLKPKVG